MINYKPAVAILFALGLSIVNWNNAYAESPYSVLKVGAFLPNGKGSNESRQDGGLKDFDMGFNAEAGFGFYLAPYCTLEAGAGYSRAERNDTVAGTSQKYTLATIPITTTIRYVITNDPFEFSVGAGLGYYFSAVDWVVANSTGSTHGTALGYHLVGGADYRMNESLSLGAEVKWNSVEPKIDLSVSGGGNKKWEVGGTTLNLTAKYRF